MKNPEIVQVKSYNHLNNEMRYAVVHNGNTLMTNVSYDYAVKFLADSPNLFETSLETIKPNRKPMTLYPFVDDSGEFIGVYFEIGDAGGNVVFENNSFIIDDYNEHFTEDMTNRILSASKRYYGLAKIRKMTADQIRNSYYSNGILVK